MKFYGDDTYGSSNQATAKITVTRVSTNLTSSDVYALYHEDAYLVATLKDADGPMSILMRMVKPGIIPVIWMRAHIMLK